MNKNDLKLVGVLLIIISIFFIIINITKKEGKTAVVYYEDKEILKIDLNTNKEYTVKGYLGDVVLEVKNKKMASLPALFFVFIRFIILYLYVDTSFYVTC